MAEAKRDGNYVPTLLAVSNANGTTPIVVKVSPTNHGLGVIDGVAGSNFGGSQDVRDGNYVVALMGVSAVDGITPTAVYADAATGKLLVRTT